MKFVYTPYKLLQTKEAIKEKHKKTGEKQYSIIASSDLKKLIFEIVALQEKEVEDYSYILTEQELYNLCVYLPQNTYKVELKNIMQVIDFRFSIEMMVWLYQTWQNFYFRKENKLIFATISNNNIMRNEFRRRFRMESTKLVDSIENKSVVEVISSEANKSNVTSLDEFKIELKAMGINLQSKLGVSCIAEFYLFCSASVYVTMGERAILTMLEGFDSNLQKRLLVNLLAKLNEIQLNQFFKVAQFYQLRSGEEGSAKYNHYFESIEENIKEAYRAWINRLHIHNVFGEDDRSKFWSRFSLQSHVRYVPLMDCLIFEFSKSIFIEFREAGPVYEFTKEYYEDRVQSQVNISQKPYEFKHWLKNYSQYKMRKVHTGYWQYEVEAHIRRSL